LIDDFSKGVMLALEIAGGFDPRGVTSSETLCLPIDQPVGGMPRAKS
jgi:hypothetical protein